MRKEKRAIFAGLLVMLALGLLIAGCGGDEGAKTEEKATLPEDTGESMLLDTTVTDQAPPAEVKQEATEKPAPKPKPVKKEEPKPEPKPEPQIVRTIILPENTPMEVTLLEKISTAENHVGDKFQAMVKGPAEKNQELNLPEGTTVEGVIEELNDGTADKEKALLKLKFTTLTMPGESPIPIEGYIITDDSTGIIRPGAQATTIAKDAGIGAIAGGVLGAITGKKGDKNETAAKGAAAGAVIGGVAGALLHKDRVEFKENADTKIIVVSGVIKETVKQ